MKEQNIITYSQIKNSMIYNNNPEIISFHYTDKNNHGYYFKANNKYTFDYNEIIANIIAQKLKMNTINIIPCCYKHKDGIVYQGILSKDFINSRENLEIIHLDTLLKKYQRSEFDMNVEDIMNVLSLHVYMEKKDGKNIELDKNLPWIFIKQHYFYLSLVNKILMLQILNLKLKNKTKHTYCLLFLLLIIV